MASFGSDLVHKVLGGLTAHLHPANPMFPPTPILRITLRFFSLQSWRYTFLVSLVRSICKAFGRFMTQRPSSVSWRPPAGPRITGTCIHNNHMPGTAVIGVLWQKVQERGSWCDSWLWSAHCLVGTVCGGCSSHERHTINSDTLFGGCGSLVTPLFGTHCPLCSQCLSLSGARCRPRMSMNVHWCSTWNVTPAHLPWLCASETTGAEGSGAAGRLIRTTSSKLRPCHSHNGPPR